METLQVIPQTELLPAVPAEEILEPIPSPLTHDLAMHYEAPPVTQSSGTWLRRGLWYADLEAVVMSRTWNKHDFLFAQQPIGNSPFNGVLTLQRYVIGESSPGAEGHARLSLGRFLFRDYKNRDHNAEMVVFGGGEWTEEISNIQTTLPNTNAIDVASVLDGNGTQLSFTGAGDMDLAYTSRISSFEWNYSVTDRLRRDRMSLQPNGQWVRKAAAGVSQEFLIGLRFLDLEENVEWSAN